MTETDDIRRLLAGGCQLHTELTLELLGIAPMERVNREYLLRHGYRQPPARCGNGHDITSDEAIFAYADHTGMRWRCRICVSEKNAVEAERRKAQRQQNRQRHPTLCAVCKAPFVGSVNRRTCGDACKAVLCGTQGRRHQQKRAQSEGEQLIHSHAILELMAERDRCATHWERAEVDARIAQVRARGTL